MQIGIVNAAYSGGGAARVATHMANHWNAQGQKVTLFSFEDEGTSPAYPVTGDVEYCYLSLDKHSTSFLESISNNFRRFRRIRRALKSANLDVLISFVDTANVRVLLAMLFSGLPIIISERAHPAHTPLALPWRLLRALSYWTADALVVQTEEIAAYAKRWRVQNTCVIPNPVSELEPSGQAPTLDRPCIVGAGRYVAQKRFDLLLGAFAEVADKHDDWKLIIAGDGPLRNDLIALADHLKLDHRVQIIGPQPDMGGIFQQADIFVLSSDFEGFPNALCEAMAAGVPCISTDCPSGPSELIEHGRNGMLVPVGNRSELARALDQLMSSGARRKELGADARLVTETYGIDRVMRRWDRLIQRVATRT